MPAPLAVPLVAAGIGGLGSLASGIFGAKNNRETNETNRAIARAQMRFQERMSNTAHQRQTKDLMAAGLNPILSATGGSGSSTPGGSSATMQERDSSVFERGVQNALGNAKQAMETESLLKAQNAQTGKTVAETLNTLEQGKLLSKQVEGQDLANARAAGLQAPEIMRAKIEAQRSHIAKQREDAEGKYKALRAKEDEKNVWWDKKSEQVGDFLDNVTSGLNVFKMFTKPKPKPDRGAPGPRQRTFEGAARKAGSTP